MYIAQYACATMKGRYAAREPTKLQESVRKYLALLRRQLCRNALASRMLCDPLQERRKRALLRERESSRPAIDEPEQDFARALGCVPAPRVAKVARFRHRPGETAWRHIGDLPTTEKPVEMPTGDRSRPRAMGSSAAGQDSLPPRGCISIRAEPSRTRLEHRRSAQASPRCAAQRTCSWVRRNAYRER
jgi:hypothetical protein